MRRNIPNQIKRGIAEKNKGVCCICRRRDIGIHLHHIDGNPANNKEDNMAVLCVEEHDEYHRPSSYPRSHFNPEKDEIIQFKKDWENTVEEANKKRPRLVATLNLYGSNDVIHSGRLIFQNDKGGIVHEKLFSQLTGTPDTWTDEIIDEVLWLNRNIVLTVSKPLDLRHSIIDDTAYKNPLEQKEIDRILSKYRR